MLALPMCFHLPYPHSRHHFQFLQLSAKFPRQNRKQLIFCNIRHTQLHPPIHHTWKLLVTIDPKYINTLYLLVHCVTDCAGRDFSNMIRRVDVDIAWWVNVPVTYQIKVVRVIFDWFVKATSCGSIFCAPKLASNAPGFFNWLAEHVWFTTNSLQDTFGLIFLKIR